MIKQDILDDGSKPLELQPTPEPGLEPVIGEIVEEGPNYRNVRKRLFSYMLNARS